ncbi:hypothetical protein KIN20_019453 [Parelaphostrongylus tenuis]|uniref:Transposase n=1 Tax=Parelaphostrongylus tenuis TaxID=148309 RepID=A0AAD5N283_PARTN|nr:hypothetical protein KIN20_019453 [Parelaphostrongylus tenuis]
MATELHVSLATVLIHLYQLNFVHKKSRQEQHDLTEEAANRAEISHQLLRNSPLNSRFWKVNVALDENWISVPNCKSINVGHYCQQSGQVYDKLKKKEAPALVNRKQLMMLQDNATPHTAKKIEEKFNE